MEAVTLGRRGSLVLDVRSRAAFVEGQRVELSPKEFELLAELAARPGEPVRTEELIRSVWPDSFGMTSQEVRWHIWRLRQAIGDDKRDSRIVANRRGFGYLIDLAPQEIELLDAPNPPSPDGEKELKGPEASTTQLQIHKRSGPRRRKTLVLFASGSALVLLAGIWVATSRRLDPAENPHPATAPKVVERSQPKPPTGSVDRTRQSRRSKHEGRGRRTSSRSQSGSVGDGFSSESIGFPVASSGTNPSDPSPERSRDLKHSGTDAGKEEEPPAPQPNAELFHLYNPDTGDHFLTMSSSTANQKQASGYQLIVEGGVFTDHVKGTVAIVLDDGTAYIFRDKASASETNVAPLYRLEKDSAFFYTSSSSSANQAEAQGWTRAAVGYVAT